MGRTLVALFLTGCLAALALATGMKPPPVSTDTRNTTEVSASERRESLHLPSMEENLVLGKEKENRAIFSEIGRDLPPEVAVKTATKMLEEEAERRKKFRSMMRSLVQSDLPRLDPSLESIEEEMKKTPSRDEEAGERSKQEEDVTESPPSIAHILPFMSPQSFLPFLPFRSLFATPDSGKEGFPESENSRMVIIERIPLPLEQKSANKGEETSLNNPMMLFIPRRTLRIDMTYIPPHRDSSKKFTRNEGDVKALEISPQISNPDSIRVLSSGVPHNQDSVSFVPRGPLALERILNFFRFNDDEEEVAEGAKLKQPEAQAAQKGTRRKREATSIPSNPVPAEEYAAAVETSHVKEAPLALDDHYQSSSRTLESERKEEQTASKSNDRLSERPVMAPRPPFFPPMATALFPDTYHRMDPYFRFMPFYMGPRSIYPYNLQMGLMHGVAPVVPGTPLEQQIVAKNQLSFETASGEAAKSNKESRRKRNIANDAPFQPQISASYNSWVPGLERKSGDLRGHEEFLAEMETGPDPDENNAEVDQVVQSKLLLKGDPETMRNPHFKLSFGSEELLKKDEDHDQYASKLPIVFKGNNEKYKSFKKHFLMPPEKKVSKKKLTGMETSPSDVNSDLREPPAPHPWRIPEFTGRMAPSLLGEGERPMADEGPFFRGKRSVSHVQFLHPYIDPESEGHLKAIEDNFMSEGSNDMYLSEVAGNRRRNRHRVKILSFNSNINKEKGHEQQMIKINRDHMPWLDPTMLGEDHEGHLHRNYPNDFKFSSYDH